MNRITIRLTLDVTYEPNNTHTDDLEDNLNAIAARASREGWLTAGTDAEVVTCSYLAEELP